MTIKQIADACGVNPIGISKDIYVEAQVKLMLRCVAVQVAGAAFAFAAPNKETDAEGLLNIVNQILGE
jgi:hypothetical protein